MKQSSELRASDFVAHRVWEYAAEGSGHDECAMVPVSNLPVEDLDQRCLGTQVRLADGSQVWVILHELWPKNLKGTIRSQWFTFLDDQRSCDWPLDVDKPGSIDAAGVANFLGRDVGSVFPFSYDVSEHVEGNLAVTQRSVQDEEAQLKS